MKVMKTYVAEKPKLGKAIAAELAKKSPKIDSGVDYVQGADWAVCWAAGHIFEQVDPDYYIAAKFPTAKKNGKGKFVWIDEHVPIFPGTDGWPAWKIELVADKAGLFKTIKRLVKEATVVVNAGDPDAEGQLLIDEILGELGNTKPVRRVLISGFDSVTVSNGLRDERDNNTFKGLMLRALGRSHSDWLWGMNGTRAVTLQAKRSGYGGTHVPIGRVQTPLLGLIVARDLEIENFKPVDYFNLIAKLKVDAGEFLGRWKPHEGQAGLDGEGRLLDRRIADQLNAHVKGKAGQVISYDDEQKQEGPPLPFSVDKLQILASKKYGYRSDDVLKALQALYETHDLTTYPRSDCQFLPEGQFADANQVIAAVKNNLTFEGPVLAAVDDQRKSRAWNDSKVTAHHAIIPTTTKKSDLSGLSKIQRDLYDEICRRYLAQFMPPRKYRSVRATVDIGGQHFVSTGTTTLSPGWKIIYGAVASDDDESKKGDESVVLPPMSKGQSVMCHGLDIEPKKTTPPEYFTDGTLLEAMINIHKHVTDPRIKSIFEKMLSDKKGGDEEGACGLGTPATRHTFVPKLVESGMLICKEPGKGGKKKSKETIITSTDAGRAVVKALPQELSKPDMTALWETGLGGVEEGKVTIEQFMAMQAQMIVKIIATINASPLVLPDPPTVKKTTPSGAPKTPASPAGKNCPKCGSPMMKRTAAKGPFLGCSGYPGCKHTEQVVAEQIA